MPLNGTNGQNEMNLKSVSHAHVNFKFCVVLLVWKDNNFFSKKGTFNICSSFLIKLIHTHWTPNVEWRTHEFHSLLFCCYYYYWLKNDCCCCCCCWCFCFQSTNETDIQNLKCIVIFVHHHFLFISFQRLIFQFSSKNGLILAPVFHPWLQAKISLNSVISIQIERNHATHIMVQHWIFGICNQNQTIF